MKSVNKAGYAHDPARHCSFSAELLVRKSPSEKEDRNFSSFNNIYIF